MRAASFSKIFQKIALLFAAATLSLAPANAQIESVDPNEALGAEVPAAPSAPKLPVEDGVPGGTQPSYPEYPEEGLPSDAASGTASATDSASGSDGQLPAETPTQGPDDQRTYQEDDLIGAAEGVFGKGAEGLGKLIQDILKKQGQPNGYIVGREAGGAFVVGLRYGSGTLFHKVEGERPVYWTGPSIGFDAGGNAGSTFVLVYNLYDTEDLFKRFASAEGVAYLVGGFNAAYLRRGDVVLIPIRVGAGLRLGANVGYMKMSKKRRWLPF